MEEVVGYLEYGKLDFNGLKNVNACVEFVKGEFGNELVIHLPEGTPTSNWYHAVRLITDLPRERVGS